MKLIIYLFIILISLLLTTGCFTPYQPEPLTLGQQQSYLALIDRGTAALRAGELEMAKAAFEVSYQIQASAEALDGLGCVAFFAGDFISARDYFLEAYNHDQTYGESLSHLATLYDFLGFHDEAQQLFVRAVNIQPDNAKSRNNYGALLYKRQYSASARSEFHRAYVIMPHEIIDKNLKKAQSNISKE
jgi:Tfp pilus assembly protein PilF